MGDQIGGDVDRTQLEFTWHNVVKGDVPEIAHPDWKERRGQIAGDSLAQSTSGGYRSPYMDLHLGIQERRKEGKPLDVIHVEMAQQNVDSLMGEGTGLEGANPAPSIEDDETVTSTQELDRRRVSPIAQGSRPGHGDRAAGSPEPDSQTSISQNVAKSPRKRRAWPSMGIDETATFLQMPSKPQYRRSRCEGIRLARVTPIG